MLPDHIQIIDYGEAVAKQTKNLLADNIGFNVTKSSNAVFYSNTEATVLRGILGDKYQVIEQDF